VAKNCNRDRADAAGGAGHQHRRAHGVRPAPVAPPASRRSAD
jgi:hypothetical protein